MFIKTKKLIDFLTKHENVLLFVQLNNSSNKDAVEIRVTFSSVDNTLDSMYLYFEKENMFIKRSADE